MVSLDLRGIRRLLCIGAHCDDIEIGCGAAVLEMARAIPDLEITWVVLSSTPQREGEARTAFNAFAHRASKRRVFIKDFRMSYFPYAGHEIKDFFEELKTDCDSDLIFTHAGGDFHQDHRLVSELTWNTFRDNLILEYEIPKYDGDMGRPNVYLPVSHAIASQKSDLCIESFKSQAEKRWFSADTFLGLMRIRGVECNAPDGFAEAFYSRKLVLGL